MDHVPEGATASTGASVGGAVVGAAGANTAEATVQDPSGNGVATATSGLAGAAAQSESTASDGAAVTATSSATMSGAEAEATEGNAVAEADTKNAGAVAGPIAVPPPAPVKPTVVRGGNPAGAGGQ